MVDANILISAILFPNSIVSGIFKHIIEKNEMVLCQYTIDEIKRVFNKKFPQQTKEMEIFLEKLSYELFEINETEKKKYPNIRDIGDIPVLINAIESNVDIFITGDQDFDEIRIKKPIIMKPSKYRNEFME